MKLPGPDHPIRITASPNRIVVRLGGREIANSTRALTLQEASYPPVLYIPREDADMAALQPAPHASHCPYKGDANYYTISVDGRTAENAVWSYEAPYDAVAEIKNHLAFYPSRVDAIEETPA